jgi:hypothetical protein
MLIGLTGYAGSGKSEVARILAENGWTRAKFAAPLKNMLRCLLLGQGLNTGEVERMIEGDLKETPSDLLSGRSPRHAMQSLGTEWGRRCIGEGLWIDAAMRGFSGPTVFDDCRFPNEASAIRSRGGIVIEISRPGVGPVNGHVSENLVAPDRVIHNDGDLALLRGRVLDAVTDIRSRL